MSLTMLNVDGVGDDVDDPVWAGAAVRLTLAKHGASDAFRRCWITVGDACVTELTDACVESDEEVTVDVTAGIELPIGSPAVLSVVHFTASQSGHTKAGIYAGGTE